ncbi:MAG TPA: hypothetical protein DD727_07945 [Clostridiales bacterium]|nr:hypothetical protein [Clostridiales bacterium]
MEYAWIVRLFAWISAGLLGMISRELSGLDSGFDYPFLLAFLFTLYFQVIIGKKHHIKRYFLLPFGMILAGLGIGYGLRAVFAIRTVDWTVNTVAWFPAYLSGITALVPSYSFGILSALIFFFCGITVLLLHKRQYLILLVFQTVMLLSQWFLYPERIRGPALWGFCFMALFLLLENVRKNRLERDRHTYHDGTVYLQWMLPLCLLISLTAVMVPAKPRPIVWPWLDNILFPHSDKQVTEMDPFSLATAGYGQGEGLGGIADPNDTVVLQIQSKRPVYLKALTRDSYTDKGWENTDMTAYTLFSPDSSVSLDRKIWDNSTMSLQDDKLDSLSIRYTFNIRFQGIRTKNIFYPIVLNEVKAGRNILWADSGGGIRMLFLRSEGFSYQVESDVPNYGDPDFEAVLKKSASGGSDPKDGISDPVRKKYLQLPDKLSENIRILSLDLTESHALQIDKVTAVEEFFKNSFTYTLTPPEPPEGTDALEYFLFEGKSGYCTYYATAMVILLRCAGIPARYAEGYAMPALPSSENTYLVTNQDAHAWPEVYFQSVGWIPFEPTPPMYERLYWAAGGGTSRRSNSQQYDYMEEPLPEEMEMTDILAPDPVRWGRILLSVLITFLILGMTTFFLYRWNGYRRIRYRDEVRRMVPAKCCVSLFLFYLRLLTLAGYPRKPWETVREYALHQDLPKIELLILAHIFDKARYGRGKMDAEDTREMLEAYEPMMAYARSQMGRVRYFLLGHMAGLF